MHDSRHFSEPKAVFANSHFLKLNRVIHKHFQVTSIDSNKDGTAEVNFYMSSADGSLVPADTATAVYNRLHPSDVSAYMGAQVIIFVVFFLLFCRVWLLSLSIDLQFVTNTPSDSLMMMMMMNLIRDMWKIHFYPVGQKKWKTHVNKILV